MAAGFNRLKRSGRPRLNPLPVLTDATVATITGGVRPPGTQVRLLQTANVTAGPPLPTAAGWTIPVVSDPRGNWTTTLTPAAAGPIKIWVALAKNPSNMIGQTASVGP